MTARFAMGICCALVLIGCGGGGDTTIINKTVTQTTKTDAPQASDVRIESPAYAKAFQHPSKFPFSVDGDLTGTHLGWSDWGASTAKAVGTFVMRDYPSNRHVPVNGTLTVSGLVSCNGKRYYTHAHLELGSGAPFKPQIQRLGTGC